MWVKGTWPLLHFYPPTSIALAWTTPIFDLNYTLVQYQSLLSRLWEAGWMHLEKSQPAAPANIPPIPISFPNPHRLSNTQPWPTTAVSGHLLPEPQSVSAHALRLLNIVSLQSNLIKHHLPPGLPPESLCPIIWLFCTAARSIWWSLALPPDLLYLTHVSRPQAICLTSPAPLIYLADSNRVPRPGIS